MSYYGDPIADIEYFKKKMIIKLGIPKECLIPQPSTHNLDNFGSDRSYKLLMELLNREMEDVTERLAYPSAMFDAGIFLVK